MKSDLKKFKPKASLPKHGLVLMFDLEGFSKFFAQPDVQMYVPKYLNHVHDAIKILIGGGMTYWYEEPEKITGFTKPMHWKFLGDGILIIWDYSKFSPDEISELLNRCWDLKNRFHKVNAKAIQDVPVNDIPQKIRFGISAGTVYKLTYENTNTEEYIGYSINLASRLQSYCRELGFVASARVNPSLKSLDESGYVRIIAKNIKGFPNEIVIIDKNEYKDLEEKQRELLFQEIE